MKLKKTITIIAALGALSFGAMNAQAEALALSNFNGNYGTTVTSCALCHTSASPTSANKARNAFGTDFKTAGGSKSAYVANYTTLDTMDSDGDLTLNGAQIAAGNAPAGNGTLASPTATATAAASTSSGGSSGGCVTAAVTTPLMMVLGMLTLGFFVRRKKS